MADVQAALVAAEASLRTAQIAATTSIGVSVVSLGTAVWSAWRQARTAVTLEQLKSRLAAENDAAKAKRDYEYEARKRLYAELYPLAFQLQEASLIARNRITNLALAAREGWLERGPNGWLTTRDPYYFNSLVHILIAPLAIYELMTRKLTLLDLTLDQDLQRQHFIARQAFEALRSDFNLVDPRYPKVAYGAGATTYAPPEDRPRTMREPRERWAWRQGLYAGQIGQAIGALLAEDETPRVMTYAEFARALGGTDLRVRGAVAGRAGEMKQALQPLTEMIRGFHPALRPVTWRILLAQAACYRAISAAQDGRATAAEIIGQARFGKAPDLADYDWFGDGTKSVPASVRSLTDYAAERDAAQATADQFLDGVFRKFALRPGQNAAATP